MLARTSPLPVSTAVSWWRFHRNTPTLPSTWSRFVDNTIHERLPEDHDCPRIQIYGLEGEMFFGSATSIDEHFDHVEARVTPATRVNVLRVKRARNPDAVGMALLEGMLDRLKARGVTVPLCGVRHEMHRVMERCGITGKLDPSQVAFSRKPSMSPQQRSRSPSATPRRHPRWPRGNGATRGRSPSVL